MSDDNDLRKIESAISFLSSVIKSGEEWTDRCEEEVSEAFDATDRIAQKLKKEAHIMSNTAHWAVTVERDGKEIVTIESNCLSGCDLGVEDEDTIRTVAYHLLAFIGHSVPNPDVEYQLRMIAKTLDEAGVSPPIKPAAWNKIREVLNRNAE